MLMRYPLQCAFHVKSQIVITIGRYEAAGQWSCWLQSPMGSRGFYTRCNLNSTPDPLLPTRAIDVDAVRRNGSVKLLELKDEKGR